MFRKMFDKFVTAFLRRFNRERYVTRILSRGFSTVDEQVREI